MIRCQCCKVELPNGAKVLLCPLCFDNLQAATSFTKVRCGFHGRSVVTARAG